MAAILFYRSLVAPILFDLPFGVGSFFRQPCVKVVKLRKNITQKIIKQIETVQQYILHSVALAIKQILIQVDINKAFKPVSFD